MAQRAETTVTACFLTSEDVHSNYNVLMYNLFHKMAKYITLVIQFVLFFVFRVHMPMSCRKADKCVNFRIYAVAYDECR